MHLRSCHIQNYRALEDAALDFGALTVLVGENGCGKSSVLNALEACLGWRAPEGTFALAPQDFHRPGPMRIRVRLQEDEAPSGTPPWEDLRRAGLAHPDGRLDFELQVEAGVEGGRVQPRFRFEGPRAFAGDPVAALADMRRAVPLLRIRSAILRPPPRCEEDGEALSEDAAREQVDWHIRQAFDEFLERPDEVSEEALEQARHAVAGAMERLESRAVAPPAGDARSRILAPLSTSPSWTRLAGLLRGSGARSLAMLAFTEAFLAARGAEALPPEARPVVSVEDPEAYLHPLTLASVWGLVQSLPAQKIVTTNSADLLAAVPLDTLRRMVRNRHGHVTFHGIPAGAMDLDDLRRIAYHLRVRRGTALFMRFWLLVEGETEFWLLPEAARAMGIDLSQEGIGCLEFAQSGLAPLASFANHLGIGWHLLADGDTAGQHYVQQARPLARSGVGAVTMLPQVDVEHCLWSHGYQEVFRSAAGRTESPTDPRPQKVTQVIDTAIRKLSKPGLALALGEAMLAPDSPGVPDPLREMLADAVQRARHGSPAANHHS